MIAPQGILRENPFCSCICFSFWKITNMWNRWPLFMKTPPPNNLLEVPWKVFFPSTIILTHNSKMICPLWFCLTSTHQILQWNSTFSWVVIIHLVEPYIIFLPQICSFFTTPLLIGHWWPQWLKKAHIGVCGKMWENNIFSQSSTFFEKKLLILVVKIAKQNWTNFRFLSVIKG